MPGSGSLMAGRRSGYAQLLLSLGGMIISIIFGLRALFWMLANWSRLHDPAADPFAAFGEMLAVLRWAILGLGIFALGWLWALSTGYAIIRSAKNDAPAPPRL